MPNIDEQGKSWQKQNAARIGQGIAALRASAGLSAVQLSERCKELGFPISRVAISKIENGSREGKLDLAEIITLARALEVPPIELIYPGLPDEVIEPAPGEKKVRSSEAAQWFWGRPTFTDYPSFLNSPHLHFSSGSKQKARAIEKVALVRDHERLRRALIDLESRLRAPDHPREQARLQNDYAKVAAEFDILRALLRDTFGAVVADDVDLQDEHFDG